MVLTVIILLLPVMVGWRVQRLMFPKLKDILSSDSINHDEIFTEADPRRA